MENTFRGYQRLEEILRDKDTEIEQLKREKQEHVLEIQELNAKLVGIQKLAIPTRSSSPSKKQQPTSVFADLPIRPVFNGFDTPSAKSFGPTPSSPMLPPRPTPFCAAIEPASQSTILSTLPVSESAISPTLLSSREKKQQPTSVLANVPARPVFTGFDIPQTESFTLTSPPQMVPPRPMPFFATVEPTTKTISSPPILTRPARRPKGTVPPLSSHHEVFGAGETKMLHSTPTFQNDALPVEIKQHSGGASLHETVYGKPNQPSDNEKEGNGWRVAQQLDGNPRWF